MMKSSVRSVAMVGAVLLAFAAQAAHPRVVIVRLQDATDSHNELVFETEVDFSGVLVFFDS